MRSADSPTPPRSDPSPIRGGRRAAAQRLAAIDPPRYRASRNHLKGAVTGLSPYIRHGVLSLAEVRDAVFAWLAEHGDPDPGQRRRQGEKLINELGWRDYWQRLWLQWGDGIWHDREPLKTGHAAAAYADSLPDDIRDGHTGLACMDGFAQQLLATGWLHNHARMWLASYVVHWRRIRWQAGARWFLEHLIDADPASNNLSWQWVASSFSHKPYVFNRANLERFSSGVYCRHCRLAGSGCPFEASYEQLQQRLFGPAAEAPAAIPGSPSPPATASPPLPPPPSTPPQHPILWIHDEGLGPSNPALQCWPGRSALAVVASDPEHRPGTRRLAFISESLQELPVIQRDGDPTEELLAFAAEHGADGVVTSTPVDPHLRRLCSRLAGRIPLQLLEPEPFVPPPRPGEKPLDLGRFSRYWRRAEPRVWARFPG